MILQTLSLMSNNEQIILAWQVLDHIYIILHIYLYVHSSERCGIGLLIDTAFIHCIHMDFYLDIQFPPTASSQID